MSLIVAVFLLTKNKDSIQIKSSWRKEHALMTFFLITIYVYIHLTFVAVVTNRN